MHTLQIAETKLDDYRNEKLTDERLDFLKTQVNEQLAEIRENTSLYESFMNIVNPPEKIDDIILWILFMSNEDIVEEYVDECSKSYREIIPVSDLADLLLYVVHLKKLKDTVLDGAEYLFDYQHEGMAEMDQYAFTNVLLFIQQKKEAPIDFSF